jgi:hypothetical protein
MAVYNIVFQSNSIDGWFSAFLTGQLAPSSENDLVFFHPIDARNPDTWPSPEKLAPITIAKKPITPSTDLERNNTHNDKAYCFFIDCTPNIDGKVCSEYLVDLRKDFNMILIDNNPIAQMVTSGDPILVVHDPNKTTISIVWDHFTHEIDSVPDWINQVNRIESWKMKGDDSAIRENLLEICRLPTIGCIEKAMFKTTEYLATYNDEKKAEVFLTEGKAKLKLKIDGFAPLLTKCKTIILTTSDCSRWGFPLAWVDKTIVYVNSTGFSPDSSELATCAFSKYPGDAFINYRMRRHPNGEIYYVYSGRVSPTSDFSLIEYGSPFKGFEKSAGAVISIIESYIPFIH